MAIASKLTSIGIIALSLAIGLFIFYIMGNQSKEQKKKQIGELVSQLVNFILFIWLSKILLNVSLFVKDPLSVLAYPSDSKAFYLAVLFSEIVLIYKAVRKKINLLLLIESFLYVFLIGSFVHEFIQFIWGNHTYAFGYLVLSSILLVLFFFLHEKVTTINIIIVMLIGWSVGMIILNIIQPFVSLFGYTIEPWFVGLFSLLNVSIIFIKKRKKDL